MARTPYASSPEAESIFSENNVAQRPMDYISQQDTQPDVRTSHPDFDRQLDDYFTHKELKNIKDRVQN